MTLGNTLSLFTLDTSLDMNKQPEITVYGMCFLGVILVFLMCISVQYP